MKCAEKILGVAALLLGVAGAAGAQSSFGPDDIQNSQRAEFNWMMNCQGCHGVNGEGSAGGAPAMAGVVGNFLHVEGGRAYLARVPGVVNAPLGNEELADLLNWMLLRFACEALPTDFSAYKQGEIERFRQDSLITSAHEVRAALVSEFEAPAVGTVAGTAGNREASCLR